MKNPLPVVRFSLIFALAVCLAPACHRKAAPDKPSSTAQAPCPDQPAEVKATRQFLQENRERCRASLRLARQWVEQNLCLHTTMVTLEALSGAFAAPSSQVKTGN